MDIVRRNNVVVTGNPDGRAVVLAHGFGCDQNMWRLTVPAVAADHRVVLFDYVGSGRSDLSAFDELRYSSLGGYAEDVLEVCAALDLTDAVFVGHSVSAMIGVLAAQKAPERIGALVMVAPSPCYVDDGDYHGGFSVEDIDELLELAGVATTSGGLPRWRRSSWVRRIGPSSARNWPTASAPPIPRWLACSRGRRSSRTPATDLATIRVPTLILESAVDAIAPRQVGAYVRDTVQGSTLVTLDATGHCPHLSEPDATNEAITDFLAKLR